MVADQGRDGHSAGLLRVSHNLIGASYTALVVEHRTNVSGPISWHRNLQPQIVFCRFFTGAALRSSARPAQQLGSAVPAPRLLLGERPWRVQSIHHPLALCSGVLNIVPRAHVGPTSMRKPLSRPERDDCGTSQTSIRRHPPRQSAMREYAVAPIQYRGVAMRHVGPRDATCSPATDLDLDSLLGAGPMCVGPGPGGNQQLYITVNTIQVRVET